MKWLGQEPQVRAGFGGFIKMCKKKSHSFLLLALTLPKLNAELHWLCTLFFAHLTFNTIVSGPLISAEILRGKYAI